MQKNIPILIDFDGVVKLGNQIAPDAKEFFDFINEEKILLAY
jgi:ribonucleotide monophosphatase NagD (HAD superfamily)